MNEYFEKFKSYIQTVTPTMSEKDIKLFFLKAQDLELQKGEIFVREGAICTQLLFIYKGLLRYYFYHDGNDITKDFAVDTQNPFCTAYTSFMLQRPSEIWIEALEPCTFSSWHSRDVLPLFQDHPLWLQFSKTMADQLFYRKEKKEIELLKCSAEERYRRFLLDYPGLSQRVPQYHIASYLGITPESLSRIRSRKCT